MSVMRMRAVAFPSGETIPALGMGTWHLGQGRHPEAVEIEALQTGLDLGMTLVDTAEMYGDGALGVVLEQDDIVKLDAAFPPPPRPVPLEVL